MKKQWLSRYDHINNDQQNPKSRFTVAALGVKISSYLFYNPILKPVFLMFIMLNLAFAPKVYADNPVKVFKPIINKINKDQTTDDKFESLKYQPLDYTKQIAKYKEIYNSTSQKIYGLKSQLKGAVLKLSNKEKDTIYTIHMSSLFEIIKTGFAWSKHYMQINKATDLHLKRLGNFYKYTIKLNKDKKININEFNNIMLSLSVINDEFKFENKNLSYKLLSSSENKIFKAHKSNFFKALDNFEDLDNDEISTSALVLPNDMFDIFKSSKDNQHKTNIVLPAFIYTADHLDDKKMKIKEQIVINEKKHYTLVPIIFDPTDETLKSKWSDDELDRTQANEPENTFQTTLDKLLYRLNAFKSN